MNRIYCDGTIDEDTKMGVFCVVLIQFNKKPAYYVVDHDNSSINGVEFAAVQDAIKWAGVLIKRNNLDTEIVSDSMSALKKSQKPEIDRKIKFRHMRAHQIYKFKKLEDDVKYNHWCDRMCSMRMAERKKMLDSTNTSE
jgi:ribonuclease HI